MLFSWFLICVPGIDILQGSWHLRPHHPTKQACQTWRNECSLPHRWLDIFFSRFPSSGGTSAQNKKIWQQRQKKLEKERKIEVFTFFFLPSFVITSLLPFSVSLSLIFCLFFPKKKFLRRSSFFHFFAKKNRSALLSHKHVSFAYFFPSFFSWASEVCFSFL